MALSYAFLSSMILLHWVASYVVVSRTHWLGFDYSTAISYWLGFFTLFQWRHISGWNSWCVIGGRRESGSFSWRMRLLMFSIYVRLFGPLTIIFLSSPRPCKCQSCGDIEPPLPYLQSSISNCLCIFSAVTVIFLVNFVFWMYGRV